MSKVQLQKINKPSKNNDGMLKLFEELLVASRIRVTVPYVVVESVAALQKKLPSRTNTPVASVVVGMETGRGPCYRRFGAKNI
jgi:hypothetical protein